MVSQSKFLDSATKFKISNARAHSLFTEDEFFQWTAKHHYRTNSNDMTSKVSSTSQH